MNGSLDHREDVAKYSLKLSYDLISHYDSKTNQQLTIAGFDFAIISMLIAAMFTTGACGEVTKIVIIVLSAISYIILAKALWEIRSALMPHVIHHKGNKSKPGILYFKDIIGNFSEEEYVSTLIGKEGANHNISKYYRRVPKSRDDSEHHKLKRFHSEVTVRRIFRMNPVFTVANCSK